MAEEDFVGKLGATETDDYTGDLSAHVRAIAPDGVDVVLHFAGDGGALAGLLTTKVRLASTINYGATVGKIAISVT